MNIAHLIKSLTFAVIARNVVTKQSRVALLSTGLPRFARNDEIGIAS